MNARFVAPLLKVCVLGALLAAALLSPLALSPVPLLLLSWYVVQWRWRFSALIDIMTQLFMVYALALLFVPSVGLWFSPLPALPALATFNHALEQNATTAVFADGKPARRFTWIWQSVLAIFLGVLLLASLLGSISLFISSALVFLYLMSVAVYSHRHFPNKPVRCESTQFRCIAGQTQKVLIRMASAAVSGGTLCLRSPYDWLRLSPPTLSFRQKDWPLKISFTPELSGPASIRLEGYAIDRWGLIETNFEIEPLSLLVIPRARYAAWLAGRYLSDAGGGTLPIASANQAIKSLFGLRSGLEYYGSCFYQPGDSLKNIDWRSSIKFNELISKEFTEPHTRPAILLVNLTANDAVAADKLVYRIIVAAISLAREGIPTSLAAYSHEAVALTTPPLRETELVLRSLQIVKEINIIASPSKYLKPPDVARLRSNLNRLRQVDGGPAAALTELLQVEYDNLSRNARSHPCTLALAGVKSRSDRQSSVLSVSVHNHDAEALEFNSYVMAKSGSKIIQIFT